MKKAVVTIAVAFVVPLLAGPTATVAATTSVEATPLRLKIVSLDGKPKIKAARKLSVVVGCNRDCRVSIRFVLRMPAGNLRSSVTRNLFDGVFSKTGVVLNGTARRYLRDNYRASSFKVVIRARNLENGTRATKKRIFRFYR